ncbi:hypothetical protein ACIOMM_31890 [Streptomyces sp. NPDC087908]|uniref:hypothetical protein n=1 Tax=Streptomyces sp. NPDC087908 TaxID=3365820 RepID=UPI003802FF4B
MPTGASWAADRLTKALGEPRRFRPRVTASAIGHLVRAGLLTYLGGEPAFPDVHPDQVAALARRRDLPALLDRHVPLGPDQAAHRLGVRRTDFDQAVRLGWVTPTATVDIDYKRHGGWTTVPLFSGQDVALLPLTRPSVDWHALRTLTPGRRSPLAALPPTRTARHGCSWPGSRGSPGSAGRRWSTGAAGTPTSPPPPAAATCTRSSPSATSSRGSSPTTRSPFPPACPPPPWLSARLSAGVRPSACAWTIRC